MINLQIEFNCLKEDSFQRHDFFSRILSKTIELSLICQTFHSFYDVFTFLWGFFRLPSKKNAAGSCAISRELLKTVKHVEPMKIDSGRGHCVVHKSKGLAHLLDEPGALPPVPGLCVEVESCLVGGSVPQLLLLVVPVWHHAHLPDLL